MKPPPFAYHRPETVDEAVEMLARLGEDAKVLAGGQSLVPVLNFRLSAPSDLVDLGRTGGLDGIEASDDGGVHIGAMVTQRSAERSQVVADRAPLLAEVLPWIAHPAIRNRGTVGGSLAHADPAAELPAVMLTLQARMHVRGPAGSRQVAARDFFPGFFSTALAAGELLTGIQLPAAAARTGHAFEEVARRHGDFALAGVAALLTLDADGRVETVRLGLHGVGTGPVLSASAPAVLQGRRPDSAIVAEAARAVATEDVSPPDDVHASSAYRRHLVRVLVARALARAARRAASGESETA